MRRVSMTMMMMTMSTLCVMHGGISRKELLFCCFETEDKAHGETEKILPSRLSLLFLRACVKQKKKEAKMSSVRDEEISLLFWRKPSDQSRGLFYVTSSRFETVLLHTTVHRQSLRLSLLWQEWTKKMNPFATMNCCDRQKRKTFLLDRPSELSLKKTLPVFLSTTLST